MAQQIFGTRALTGLNVADGPHLIEDHQLRESYNGWTDQDGVWSTAPGPSRLYTQNSAISCLAAGRMDGADHVVWMDGNTLYDNGANVGTITAGSSMDIVATDDGFLILGAAKNYIWDGTHLREQGAPQVTLPTLIYTGQRDTATGVGLSAAITGITNANPAVVTTTLAPSVGDYVYIDGVVGMTELNGNVYEVTAVNGSISATINVDSSGFGTYSSGGTMYANACGLSGDYSFYVTQTVTLGDGTVLEGKPHGLKPKYIDAGWDSETATPLTISVHDEVSISGNFFWGLSGTMFYDIDGTLGTDYTPGARLYRTKANGYDFYLEKEWTHGDSDFTYTAGASPYWTISHKVYTPDSELGAVYLPGNYDHNSAPQSNYAAQVGQRVFLASGSDVYWSSLDGIEYYNQNTGFEKFPDVVTALATLRNYCVVFSADRIWLMQIATDGLPDITEIPTPVGTTYSTAITTTDDGVLFLREDGLWVFDGARVDKIAHEAFDTITSPTSVASAGNLLFVSGSSKSYVAIRRRGAVVWHESEHYRPYADATNGTIYAADTASVYSLFTGARVGGRLKTKHWGNSTQYKPIRVVLDVAGDTSPVLWVNGNRQPSDDGHQDPSPATDNDRRVVRYSVPRLNNQYVEIEVDVTGAVDLYGIWVEEAR